MHRTAILHLWLLEWRIWDLDQSASAGMRQSSSKNSIGVSQLPLRASDADHVQTSGCIIQDSFDNLEFV